MCGGRSREMQHAIAGAAMLVGKRIFVALFSRRELNDALVLRGCAFYYRGVFAILTMAQNLLHDVYALGRSANRLSK